MASVPAFSPQGPGPAAGERVLALSGTPQLSVWRRPSYARAQLARLSCSTIPKGLVASPALQPPPSDPRQMGIRMQPIAPCSSPSPPGLLPPLGRPKQPETGMAGPSGRATWASPEPASSQAGSTMAPFTRERSWPIWSPQGDVPGPGDNEWEVRNSGRAC